MPPTWARALVVALLAALLLFLLELGIQALPRPQRSVAAHALQGAFIAACCWHLCRRDPRSVWYVVPVTNLFELGRAAFAAGFWLWPVWPAVVAGWAAALVAALLGARAGRRTD